MCSHFQSIVYESINEGVICLLVINGEISTSHIYVLFAHFLLNKVKWNARQSRCYQIGKLDVHWKRGTLLKQTHVALIRFWNVFQIWIIYINVNMVYLYSQTCIHFQQWIVLHCQSNLNRHWISQMGTDWHISRNRAHVWYGDLLEVWK